jgi:hypothetical protein
MSYFVLPSSGVPVSRTTVQRTTEIEKQTDANRQRMTDFEKAIANRYKEGRLQTHGDKPDLEQWSELLETDPHFAEEFAQTFDNPDVKEADDEFDPDSYDSYLNMEIAVDRDGQEPQLARVSKRLRDNAGNPIGQANNNPILDTRLYEVEYLDGHRAAMSANTIAENMFAQVDQEDGHRLILFDEIIGHRVDGSQVREGNDDIITNSLGVKKQVQTTKG